MVCVDIGAASQATIQARNIIKDDNKDMVVDYYRKRGMLIHLGVTEEEIDRRMMRTSGDCICEQCGKEHRKHPFIDDVLTNIEFRPQPFLHLLCDGTLAKL